MTQSALQAQDARQIPHKKGWPLLGVLPELISSPDPYVYLKNIMLKYGDFVQLELGPQTAYLVSHPDYLQHILRDNYQNYPKPDILYGTLKEISPNGLGVSTGDFWLRQRRMIQPHLHRKQLGYLFKEMVFAIAEQLDNWAPLARTGTVLELGEKLGEITMNVALYTMFGKDTLPLEALAQTAGCLTRILDYAGQGIVISVLPPWLPLPAREQFKKDVQTLRSIMGQLIAQCRKNRTESAGLMQTLMDAVDEETQTQMTDEQLYDETVDLLTAGFETTNRVLTWLVVVLERYPAVAAKLKAEIAEVLGKRLPTFEDAARLTYTRQVFMEILRMYTVVPFLPRAVTQADHLGPYPLPAGAMVLIFYHGVHHNPRVWNKPEEFIPERFDPQAGENVHPFGYVPFSAGPRKCAGDEFALLEGPLIMAMMLQRYTLRTLPDQSYAAGLGATMRPKNGVKVTLIANK